MKRKRKALRYTVYAALAILFMVSVYMMELFIDETYPSDFPAHIIGALSGAGYSLMHHIFGFLHSISDRPLLMAYAMGLIIIITVYAIYKFISRIFKENLVKSDKYLRILLSISGVFLSALYIPYFYPHFYVASTRLTQPWHNSTWLLMRMFGYFTLAVYFYLVKHYKENAGLKWYVAFIVLLSLTNYSKPSFFIAFAPAMLILLIYDLIKSKGKQLPNIIKFGVCVLLSMPVLFKQMGTVYNGSDDSGVALSLNRFHTIYSGTEWIWSLLSNMLFPIIVTVVMICVKRKHKELDVSFLAQAWIMYLISYCEMLFIVETGAHAPHGNYAWGVYFFAGVLYMECMAEWIMLYKKQLLPSKKAVMYTGSCAYCLNVVAGFLYVAALLDGKFYIY